MRALREVQSALDYAATMHRGQVREVDGAPFIAHPREVAGLLLSAGVPEHLIAAGALHDVMEKTPATAVDLRQRFGTAIASLVVAVSEDESIPAMPSVRPLCASRLWLQARRP
jgi:(p)ppGpp synthase/HD superfamily hydrolase